MHLPSISSPRDLANLGDAELEQLAEEIRQELVKAVSKTGGHLGSNLGAVELTIALHKVFDSPNDHLIFDTGHQTYVHKMLTGRAAEFIRLRQPGGLSGYPSRSESSHDVVENSHASTALSWADGIATAKQLQGASSKVVAVVGDGSLTGGMAWEAINNIANQSERNLVIVVNDNGRSYSPTIGGLARHLAALRTNPKYEGVLDWGKRTLLKRQQTRPLYQVLRGFKTGFQVVTQPRGMFQDLGIKYLGPVDGHNIKDLVGHLELAKRFKGPVLVHVLTEKGKGYLPAENDEAEKFHGIGKFDEATGQVAASVNRSWTSAFSEALEKLMEQDEKVVGITAAMLGPTGLAKVAGRFPNRIFDVGIAEQHAVTAAAGMAFGGLKPVVAVYASFLNRAFDQVLLDAALHDEKVTIVLDRAGITGDDGPSHNGIWDISLLGCVPNLKVFAPWNESGLTNALTYSTTAVSGVSVIRFPKGEVDESCRDFAEDLLIGELDAPEVVVIPVGVMVSAAIGAHRELSAKGIKCQVRATTQIQPIPSHLLEKIPTESLVVTIEDGILQGGFGSRIRDLLPISQVVETMGVKSGFPEAKPRKTLLEENDMTSAGIVAEVTKILHK